jgi:hypothetical protein
MDYIYPHFGWGPNLHRYPTGDVNEIYHVGLSMLDHGAHGTFREECMINAREVARTAAGHKQRIRLLVSGGMDSHSMFYSFVLQNIEVSACVYKVYLNGVLTNEDDFERGMYLCKKHSVPVQVMAIEADRYAESAVHVGYDYSERKDLGLMLRRVAADSFTDEFVCMVGDVHTIGYMPGTATNDFVAIFKPLNPTPTPFAYKANGVSCFHQMRRASMMAYLADPVLWKWADALPAMYPSFKYMADPRKIGKLAGGVKFYEYLFKPQIFTNNWPEMQVYPKATGLEAFDFSTDENAIDITSIQLERSIVIPIPLLLGQMKTNDVNLSSKDTPCQRLLQFKKEQK